MSCDGGICTKPLFYLLIFMLNRKAEEDERIIFDEEKTTRKEEIPYNMRCKQKAPSYQEAISRPDSECRLKPPIAFSLGEIIDDKLLFALMSYTVTICIFKI